eukprot:gene6807-4887_t
MFTIKKSSLRVVAVVAFVVARRVWCKRNLFLPSPPQQISLCVYLYSIFYIYIYTDLIEFYYYYIYIYIYIFPTQIWRINMYHRPTREHTRIMVFYMD